MEDRVPSNEEGPRVKRRKRSKSMVYKVFNRRLMAAVKQTDYAATEEILMFNSFSPNVLVDGVTPVLAAICRRRIDIVKLLVSHGASVKWTGDPDVMPPFCCACAVGNVDVIKFLHDQGADLNTSYYNCGSLFWAASSRNPEAISFLCGAGITIDPSWHDGQSPLWMASLVLGDSDLTSMVAVLLRHGVPVVGNCDGGGSNRSNLHDAVRHRDKDSVVLSMECGAKPSSVAWTELDLTADPDFFAWCKRYMSQPMSLKCLSGQVVRRRLVETHKKSILPYLTQLELPKTLVEYIALDRFKYLERAYCLGCCQ